MKRVSDAVRQILEDLMTSVEWKNGFIESYVQIGEERGAAATKAVDILTVLDVHGLKPTKVRVRRKGAPSASAIHTKVKSPLIMRLSCGITIHQPCGARTLWVRTTSSVSTGHR